MPWCKVGNTVTLVDSADDCRAMSGGVVPGPGGAGGDGGAGNPDKKKDDCFIRNVLTRGLGDLVLDIGVTEKVSSKIVSNVDIPRTAVAKGRSPAKRIIALTATSRLRLATRVTRSILKLAATYKTGLDFRVLIFLQTPRGRHLISRYEHFLPEIYEVARNDYTLLNDLASAWLKVHPFIAAMVTVATSEPSGRSKAKHYKLSARSSDDAQELVHRFGKATENQALKALTVELAAELDEYRGLNAEQALARVRSSSALREHRS
jgi:hypothetical protein